MSVFKRRFTVKRPQPNKPVGSKGVGLGASWTRRQGGRFSNLVLPDPDVQARIRQLDGELDCVGEDLGKIQYNTTYRRCRPYPWDATQTLNLVDGGVPNTFGGYTQLIPIGTYSFGDTPNRLQILRLLLELMSANDVYIIEFSSSPDGVTFTSRGAVRFRRGAAIARTFIVDAPCRPFNIDADALYGRLKSALGGNNVTFALCVARFLPTEETVKPSTCPWPFG